MTVGHPSRRSLKGVDPGLTEAKATSFRCFSDPLVIGEDPPASGPQDSVGFPREMWVEYLFSSVSASLVVEEEESADAVCLGRVKVLGWGEFG
jgi:hypothetical protein